MKKDRNCGNATPYPIYPMYGMPMQSMQGAYPMMNMPMPLPMPAPTTSMNTTTGYTTSEINTLSNRINSLEQRVSNLENIVNKSYSNNYNTSNYQMM